jgi:hypothetical protein
MPLDSDLVVRARELAKRAHAGQVRKASQLPYFTHLEAVAEILNSHGYDDDETLAVAYLHDLLEDQPEHGEALRTQMPASVVQRVAILSEKKHDENGRPLAKRERFRGYVEGLAQTNELALAATPVSCADRIHNSMSLVADERAGHQPFMRLSSRPGQLLEQLERLRAVYERRVSDALLRTFDEARDALAETIGRWLPGRAVAMAADAHLGQFDRSGAPYVYHPITLAMRAGDETQRIVALLHDTVEDGKLTLEELWQEGFGESVVRAVDHLTRRTDEGYDEYIERVARDRLATRVKLLDLTHNADLSRLSAPAGEDRRRRDKYLAEARRLERELMKRSLQIVLDEASREQLRPHARLPVFKGHHVTLAHGVVPSELDPAWVPGGAEIGSAVDLEAVAVVRGERIEAALVQIAGCRVRPIDAGTLHITLSRAPEARSRDANELLKDGEQSPLSLRLKGKLIWLDC